MDLLVYDPPYPFEAGEEIELTPFLSCFSALSIASWLAALSRWVERCPTSPDLT